jgi:hypothetical protein
MPNLDACTSSDYQLLVRTSLVPKPLKPRSAILFLKENGGAGSGNKTMSGHRYYGQDKDCDKLTALKHR